MSIVKIPLDKLHESGKYDEYTAVAIEETETHLRVKRSDWRRIKGIAEKIAHAARSITQTQLLRHV